MYCASLSFLQTNKPCIHDINVDVMPRQWKILTLSDSLQDPAASKTTNVPLEWHSNIKVRSKHSHLHLDSLVGPSDEIDIAHPRRHDAPEDNAKQCKQFKAVINNTISEFICPLTQELPMDPVIAEDGNVYERVAIEQWLKHQTTSPATNKIISNNLLPTVQVKNLIRSIISNDATMINKANAMRKHITKEITITNAKRLASERNVTTTFQFESQHTSTRHLACAHGVKHNINVKRFSCEMCHKTFKTNAHLQSHLAHIHNINVKWHSCHKCEYKCKWRGSLKTHLANVHDIDVKWFSCAMSKYKCKRHSRFKQHLTDSHDINIKCTPLH